MRLSPIVFTLVVSLACAGAQTIQVDIPYEKFVLPNGLTLIVHEDRKAPIVAVNVWYHVGSKNEKPGKTGFAHLFEHLMFNGSEHFNNDYFKALEKLGATDLNGTTNNDRTNYFQNVPTSALDQVLWLESDRMGHLVGVIDQARLDEQRGVVQNEKRQYENQPYGIAYEMITKATYPAAHPYSWTVIGSMDDLTAASLADVKEWFKNYYGAANATIVVAGDIDAKTAKEKVEKYFGHIPSGPPVARHTAWAAKRTGSQRQAAQDRVSQTRIWKIWNVPGVTDPDNIILDLVASILGRGKTSRLFKRLIYDEQTATNVSVYNDTNEIAGQFVIDVHVRPGVEAAKVDRAIEEEVARFLKDGPAGKELSIAKTEFLADFLRGSERIGGFGGKSDILASCQVRLGDPACYKKIIAHREAATNESVRGVAARWLSEGVYTLEIEPFPDLTVSSAAADRSKMPPMGPPPDLKLPKFQRAALSNGLKVILAERHETPLVKFQLQADAGYAADQGAPAGTAELAMSMLLEGTATRTSLQIGERMQELGAELGATSGLDTSSVYLTALKVNLDASLELCADVVLHPSFPEKELERLRKERLAAIQREKKEPFGMALRVMPVLMYGKGHAYGTPFTGSGYESTVAKITRRDLVSFHSAWFKPNNATVIVAGDTTLKEILPKLESLFGKWRPGEVPKKNVSRVAHQPKPVVYLLDQPGAIQSTILAGHVAPPKSDPDDIAMSTTNTVFGGMFTSRINMNLREDKHWSYGAGAALIAARGQQPFIAFAPVQTDKTKESMVELDQEFRGILLAKPVTADELSFAQANLTLSLPGSRETLGAVVSSIADITNFSLPDDYYETYARKVKSLGVKDISAAAEKLIRPGNMIWVVVGDRAKIEKDVRSLNFGEVKIIDADANPAK